MSRRGCCPSGTGTGTHYHDVCCGSRPLSDEWLLDLGAGGWTANPCVACIGLAGEIIVLVYTDKFLPSTVVWNYGPVYFCNSLIEGFDTHFYIHIHLQCNVGPSWNPTEHYYIYQLFIHVGYYSPDIPEGDITEDAEEPSAVTDYANYSTNEFLEGDCSSIFDGEGRMVFPNLINYHQAIGGVCLGTLPATVYLTPR